MVLARQELPSKAEFSPAQMLGDDGEKRRVARGIITRNEVTKNFFWYVLYALAMYESISLSLSLSPTTFLPPRPHPHIDHNIYLSCKTLYQATISISTFEISRFPLQFLDILFFSSLETSRSVGRVGQNELWLKTKLE